MPKTNTLFRLSNELVSKTRKLLKGAKTEEELRIGFEKILDPILKSIGIDGRATYERFEGGNASLLKGRPDAVHGQVIIEYERPSSFASEAAFEHALDQLRGYLLQYKDAFEKEGAIGVAFDGQTIAFIKLGEKDDVDTQDFQIIGPLPFNTHSSETFLSHLRGLSRKPITAELLATEFGPQSQIAMQIVSALMDALSNWSSPKVEMFLNEWKRLFGIVYGEQFAAGSSSVEDDALRELYAIDYKVSFQELLFTIHTYFALLMKLIVAELLTVRETSYDSSFSVPLVHASREDLKRLLSDIEDGGIYAKRGVENFLEADFFRWYLEAFSPRVEEAIRELARTLSELRPDNSYNRT